MKYLINLLLILLTTALLNAQDLRDPVKWPFDKSSIWNMPIGDGAVYKPANFQAAGHVGVDIQHVIIGEFTYKHYQVLNSPTWGPGRCSGTEPLGFTIQIPDDLIIPDAGNSPYGNTPNSGFSIITPDHQLVMQGGRLSRCEAGGPAYMPEWKKYPSNRLQVSIRGNGLEGGGQGASHMSSLGGTIRLGEWSSENPIRHVVKINPWAAKYCFYSDSVKGYKWPATAADSYAPDRYNRHGDPDIVMGSLFAIPPDVTPESIGIHTEPGRKLFTTLQNYGMYFTEDAAWDTWDIIVQRDAEIEFQQTFGFSMKSDTWKAELNKLMMALSVIVNNSPDSIGGGGTPRAELAPDFAPQYKLTVQTDETTDAVTIPSGTFTVNHGNIYHVSVDSVPPGYHFSSWSVESGAAEIGDPSMETTTVTLTTGDATIAANFAADEYTLTTRVSGDGSVTIIPRQEAYLFDSQVSLTATAADGWTFSEWIGDTAATENPLILNMKSDMDIQAVFLETETSKNDSYRMDTGISMIQDANAHVIHVHLAQQVERGYVQLYRMDGSVAFVKPVNGEDRLSLSTLPYRPGIYILRVSTERSVRSFKFIITNN